MNDIKMTDIDNNETGARGHLPAAACSACSRTFTPCWLSGLKKWSKVCGRCGVLNLATFMEETAPDDTLAEISSGEQAGAWLRDMVKPNSVI